MNETEIIFKIDYAGGTLAIFSNDSYNFKGNLTGCITCYAETGHDFFGICPYFAETLEDATAEQSEALRAELVAIGYQLEEVK